MTLADAILKFQARFDVVSDEIGFPSELNSDLRDWSRAPTGDEYVAVTNGGIKVPGEPFPASHSSMEEAISAWLIEANAYADGKGATLFWRERPEIDLHSKKRWVVYSRLAIAA